MNTCRRSGDSRWAVSLAVGMCVALVYLAGTATLSQRGWYRKHGDGPAISQWLDALESVSGDFPFGYWTDRYTVAVLLNALFWAALVGGLHAVLRTRRNAQPGGAANRSQPGQPRANSTSSSAGSGG